MSIGLGIDVGAFVVKLATHDATASGSTYALPRSGDSPELVSRMGTLVPLVAQHGSGYVSRTAEDLFVEEVLNATRQVTDNGQAGMTVTTITTPDWWTDRARAAVREALAEAGFTEARLVSSGVAAVKAFRAVSNTIPDTVAVLDLGAYSCSAAVVTDCREDEPGLLGHPSVLHGRGGNDLDARILHHVLSGLRSQGLTYRPDDPDAVEAARELLAECRIAKETLSGRPAVTMSPFMPGSRSPFRLVRSEHDDIARPAVREIVQVLKDTIGAGERDVDAVLLVGGGAPIPIVVQQISVELGLPVLLDADPSTLAARGAALESSALLATMRERPKRRARVQGWLSRSRSHPPDPDRRRRARRIGVAVAYTGLGLMLTGPPSSPVAESTPQELSPTSSLQTVDPADVVPDSGEPGTNAP